MATDEFVEASACGNEDLLIFAVAPLVKFVACGIGIFFDLSPWPSLMLIGGRLDAA